MGEPTSYLIIISYSNDHFWEIKNCFQTLAMFSKLLILLLLYSNSTLLGLAATEEDIGFTYNGFRSANLSLDGMAQFTPNGLLQLTNHTEQQTGHAFYPNPITFKNSSNTTTFSFSTTFVFAIIAQHPLGAGHGIVFVIAPTRVLPGGLASTYLGVFSKTNDGNSSNHIVAVELDVIENKKFNDTNNNHVGIDINGLNSKVAMPAGYYDPNNCPCLLQKLSLTSGQPMQVWVDYDGVDKFMNVTLAPVHVQKPNTPLLSFHYDLSTVINETMYIGFSSSTAAVPTNHYILGWSFKMNGQAQGLNLSRLPELPRIGPKQKSRVLRIGLPVICVGLVLAVVSGTAYYVRWKMKYAEVLEDWELAYGPHRFKYKDLYIATNGFQDTQLLGTGGFGRVYRGVLPTSKIEIAVKRVSHESRQGMKEFVAEIVSIGRLRHRNIVQLLGYCRRKGELLLVYDYMPNGSLDKFLYDQPEFTLNWSQRFRVIKGVASGLFYLHEEWEQVVVHRDIKASNVLLDGEFNGRLGDFGLARLYRHGTAPQTTCVVGTFGYLAPEHSRTGKATTSTDVYAFGAFLLEVVCGRRPIEPRAPAEDIILIDWVFGCWSGGDILRAVDVNLGTNYVQEEVEFVLKLGLLCSHSEPMARPTMRQVVQHLEGGISLPELSSFGITGTGLTFGHHEGFDEFAISYPSSIGKLFSQTSSSVAESLLSGGR
ncbi:L-type lectin-domain containing receptor kinase IV.1-like [Cornus florida]|uniref:L-type lectin-domain containing receptor kinase IV.1-like n=1 Tax=Cornus florida TaxID=4283 RepID=UPI002897121E|nr:L-type lectin-domain containing receptor kinase IV.1-like [Cornus florida]